MLRSDDLCQNPSPIFKLSAAAHREMGSNPRVLVDEVFSDVCEVLQTRGLLVPGQAVNEVFIFRIAQNVIFSRLRKLKRSPLPLTGDIVAPLETEESELGDAVLQPMPSGAQKSEPEQLIKRLQAARPQVRKVERTVRELQKEALRNVLMRASSQVQMILERLAEGRTHEEIGAELEANRCAVSQALSRFYKEVRIEYDQLCQSG